jgi:hypothetical protein
MPPTPPSTVEPRRPGGAYRRILVPVDGSELTARAIEASVALAQQLQATIVGFIAGPPARAAVVPALADDDDERLTPAQAQPVLARFRAVAEAAGVPFEGALDPLPRVHHAIVAAAEAPLRHDRDGHARPRRVRRVPVRLADQGGARGQPAAAAGPALIARRAAPAVRPLKCVKARAAPAP